MIGGVNVLISVVFSCSPLNGLAWRRNFRFDRNSILGPQFDYMKLEKILEKRADGHCELCKSDAELEVYQVEPIKEGAEGAAMICEKCRNQIDHLDEMDVNHWRCLNDSIWSEVPAVQVLAWRILRQLRAEGWPQDLLDMMYLDDEVAAWAKALELDEDALMHLDSNGVQLEAGDTVILIKDLNVKGSSLVAKRGVAVRRISLDPNNAEYIEGKVDGQHIVILTKYVKKAK